MDRERTRHYENTARVFEHVAKTAGGNYDAHPSGITPWQRRIRKMAIQILKLSGGFRSILDAGCGNGDYVQELSKIFQPERIAGLDFSQSALDLACQRNIPRFQGIHQNLIERWPFSDREWDAAILLNVLHHIHPEDRHKVISELARVARSIVIVEIKNADNLYKRLRGNRVLGSLNVYPQTLTSLQTEFALHSFQMARADAIFYLNAISPLLLATFVRVNK